MKRREFLKASVAIGSAWLVWRSQDATGSALSLSGSRVLGANEDIRIGVIGIGSFIKIGGKGRGDIRDFRKIPGVRVVALCDCDHLLANRFDINQELLALGSMLIMDPDKERFIGPMSKEANRLISREYRKPFVVSDNV